MELVVKNPPANAGDMRHGFDSWARQHGNPVQDSCLEDPMDRGAWWATDHVVTQSDTTERPGTHAGGRMVAT